MEHRLRPKKLIKAHIASGSRAAANAEDHAKNWPPRLPRESIALSMRNNHDILYINGMLAELCHQFKTDVYDNGMRDVADSHPQYRIAGSGNFGPVKVLVGEMCGYERIMLEDDFSYITFQIRPGSTNAYVLGMQGRLPQLRHLVRTVIHDWNHREGARDAFTYDQDVSVI